MSRQRGYDQRAGDSVHCRRCMVAMTSPGARKAGPIREGMA